MYSFIVARLGIPGSAARVVASRDYKAFRRVSCPAEIGLGWEVRGTEVADEIGDRRPKRNEGRTTCP